MNKNTNKVIQTAFGELSLIEHDIIFLKYANIYLDDLSLIDEVAAQVRDLSVTDTNLSLLDVSALKGASREFRKESATDRTNTRAVALLVNSAITKIMVNIFMKFNKPKYPTRMFTNREEAIEWLLTFK